MTSNTSSIAQFMPVERDTVQERVFRRLKEAIIRGEFVPGQSITIQALATAFGVSAMPVREALRRLVAANALVSLPNRSVAVSPLTHERLRDLYRVRISVEGLAAEWAAKLITKPELNDIAGLCDSMSRMLKARSMPDLLATNQKFHFKIYEAARSPTLMPIIESLWMQTGPYLNLLHTKRGIRTSNSDHEEAVEALQRHDAAGARRAIERGLEMASATVGQLLASRSPKPARAPKLARAPKATRAPKAPRALKADGMIHRNLRPLG